MSHDNESGGQTKWCFVCNWKFGRRFQLRWQYARNLGTEDLTSFLLAPRRPIYRLLFRREEEKEGGLQVQLDCIPLYRPAAILFCLQLFGSCLHKYCKIAHNYRVARVVAEKVLFKVLLYVPPFTEASCSLVDNQNFQQYVNKSFSATTRTTLHCLPGLSCSACQL